MLPASLLELGIGRAFTQPLSPGSLPAGLHVRSFHQKSAFQHALLPGVIPTGTQMLTLGRHYRQRLVAGSVPKTLPWLRLPLRYEYEYDTGRSGSVPSPSTRVALDAAACGTTRGQRVMNLPNLSSLVS